MCQIPNPRGIYFHDGNWWILWQWLMILFSQILFVLFSDSSMYLYVLIIYRTAALYAFEFKYIISRLFIVFALTPAYNGNTLTTCLNHFSTPEQFPILCTYNITKLLHLLIDIYLHPLQNKFSNWINIVSFFILLFISFFYLLYSLQVCLWIIWFSVFS